MRKKRILALVLAVTLLVTPVGAYADSELTQDWTSTIVEADSGNQTQDASGSEADEEAAPVDSGIQVYGPYPPRWNVGDEVDGFGEVLSVEWLEEDQLYLYTAINGYWLGEDDPVAEEIRDSGAFPPPGTPKGRSADLRMGVGFSLAAEIETPVFTSAEIANSTPRTITYTFPTTGKYQIYMYGKGGGGGNGGPRVSSMGVQSPGGGGGSSGAYVMQELIMQAGQQISVTFTPPPRGIFSREWVIVPIGPPAKPMEVKLSTGQSWVLPDGAFGGTATKTEAGKGGVAGSPGAVTGTAGSSVPSELWVKCNYQGAYCVSGWGNTAYHRCSSYEYNGYTDRYGSSSWYGGQGGLGGKLPHPIFSNKIYGDGGDGGRGGEAYRYQPPPDFGDKNSTTYKAGREGTPGGACGVIIGKANEPPPVPPSNPILTKNPNKEWHNGTVTVTLSGSGSATYQYKINSSAWTNGSSVAISIPGVHTVYGRAVSNLGLISGVSSISVKIDSIAPSAPTMRKDPNTEWASRDVVVTLSGSTDAGGSGIAKYQYRVNNGAWVDGTSVTISTPGVHTVYGRAFDNAGNISTESSIIVRIEKAVPTIPNGTTNSTAEWSNRDVTVTFSGSTASSGIAKYQYRVGGGAWVDGATVTISAQGSTTVYGRAISNSGTYSGERSVVVKIDKGPTTAPLVSKNPNTEWADGSVTVTFSGSTATSGIAKYQYRVGGGAWVDGASATISATGTSTVYGRAVSNSGIYSGESSIVVNIDGRGTTAPLVRKDPSNEWHNGNVVVTFYGSTAASGIAKYQYRVGSGAWVDGDSVTISEPGTSTVYGRAVSRAGAVSPESNIAVNIDKIAPTTPVMSKTPNTAWAGGEVTVTLADSTDTGGSGHANYQYRIDEAGVWTDGATATLSEPGSYTVYGRAVDRAGNHSDESTITVNIDAVVPTAPTMSKNPAAEWYNDNVEVTLTGSTGGASGLQYQYRVGGAGVWTDGASVTISDPGTHIVYGRTVSNAGVASDESSITVNIDETAPTTPTMSKDPNDEWAGGSVVVALSGSTDAGGSGLAGYQHRVGDGDWTDGATVTVSETCTVYGRAVDRAGNLSGDESSIAVNCDTIAPTGEITASTTRWTNQPVTLTFNATDTGGSGVKQVRFSGGAWVSGSTATQVVTANGTYSFEVQDNAQNSATVTYTVSNIDTQAPGITAITVTETEDNLRNYVLGTKQMEIAITAADTGGSGIAKMEYQIVFEDGIIKELGWITYNDSARPRITNTFNGFVYARCADVAGNASAVQKSEEVFVVKNPPTITHTLRPGKDPITGEYPWTSDEVEITIQASAASGGTAVQAIILPDGRQVTGSTYTYSVSENGTYLFKILDRGRNVTPYSVQVTNIEKDLPEVESVIISDPDASGKVTITLKAKDASSGVRSIVLPNSRRVDADTAQYVVTSNGRYRFVIYDNAWNELIYFVEVTSIH